MTPSLIRLNLKVVLFYLGNRNFSISLWIALSWVLSWHSSHLLLRHSTHWHLTWHSTHWHLTWHSTHWHLTWHTSHGHLAWHSSHWHLAWHSSHGHSSWNHLLLGVVVDHSGVVDDIWLVRAAIFFDDDHSLCWLLFGFAAEIPDCNTDTSKEAQSSNATTSSSSTTT